MRHALKEFAGHGLSYGDTLPAWPRERLSLWLLGSALHRYQLTLQLHSNKVVVPFNAKSSSCIANVFLLPNQELLLAEVSSPRLWASPKLQLVLWSPECSRPQLVLACPSVQP